MDFQLSPEHEKIRGVCREQAQDFATRAAEHDREVSLPLENYAARRGAGLYGLTVPKEHGGMGGDFTGYTVDMEEVAQGDLGFCSVEEARIIRTVRLWKRALDVLNKM